MTNSCFGCCSIRHGVSCIYIFNIFLTTFVIMIDFMERLSNYNQYYQYASSQNSTSQTFSHNHYFDDHINTTLHNNSTDKHSYQKIKFTPLLKFFMDYIFIIKLAWSVMEFYLNISLKQSTYTVSPEKIYAWLVIYYCNLFSGIMFLIIVIFNSSTTEDFEYFFMCFLGIIITVVEIYFVQSYYKQQKLAAVSDFVHLKWKYVRKPKTQSDEDRSAVKITPENPLDQIDVQSDYIPIFVRDLRRANS